MRLILFLTLLVCSVHSTYAQEWYSIPETGTYKRAAYEQFIIDPFTDNMWIVAGDQVAVIESDGTIQVFTQTSGEISTLWQGNEMHFTFTPGHTYFANGNVGVFSFDNYTEQMVYNLSNSNDFLSRISSNADTVYIGFNPQPFSYAWAYLKYTPSSTTQTGKVAHHVIAKGTQKYEKSYDSYLKYSAGDDLMDMSWYIIGNDQTGHDPDYIGGQMHDVKFQKMGDSLFVAGNLGISIVYNYDLLPLNFTPSNTTNMPSANVLEIEFDESDSLWAVFGDQNDVPIAIAKLSGTNWTSVFDTNNSPIDFSQFYGLEFDAAGNLWVNDENALHTILTANSPGWLKTNALEIQSIEVYPNPAEENLWVRKSTLGETELQIMDASGRTVYNTTLVSEETELNISFLISGVYFVKMNDCQNVVKLVKQ